MRPPLEIAAVRLLPRPRPGRFLADAELRTLAALAEVMLDGAPVPISPEEVADNIDRFLLLGRSRRAWRCRVMLHLLENLPLASRYRRTFGGLSASRRRELVLKHMQDAEGLWAIAARARFLVLLGAYGDARAANEDTGYVAIPERDWFRRPGYRRRTAAANTLYAQAS